MRRGKTAGTEHTRDAIRASMLGPLLNGVACLPVAEEAQREGMFKERH